MTCESFRRDIPGSESAVLFIHGIVGTPRHFTPLMDLVPPDWTVCNLLLAGHGGTADDFARATMAQWHAQVHVELARLCREHRRVLIAAHSMGTLLALHEALNGMPIAGLFLLAVPLRIRPTWRSAVTSVKVGLGLARSDDVSRLVYGIAPEKRVWKYVKWLPNYAALLRESRRIRRLASELRVPCVVLQSLQDELVSPASADDFAHTPHVRFVPLRTSSHYAYSPEDLSLLRTAFADFCQPGAP